MNKIDMHHLRAFICVADELSYRKAASRLHVAQPALSRAIQQLERALGARLLERSTRVVQLTEIGSFFLERARYIQVELNGSIESVRKMTLGQKGELFVGFNDFTMSEILPPIIHRFRRAFPEIAITLGDEPSPTMVQMVLDHRLDIAFASGVSPPSGLESLVLREEAFVAILPVGHRLERRRRINPRELSEESFVLGGTEWGVFLRAVDEYCEGAGFRPRVVQTAMHSNDIINLVAAGIGVSVYVDREWLRHRKDIVVLPMTAPPTKFRSLAVWHRTARSASLGSFLSTMRQVISM